jgi:hypothetical protein
MHPRKKFDSKSFILLTFSFMPTQILTKYHNIERIMIFTTIARSIKDNLVDDQYLYLHQYSPMTTQRRSLIIYNHLPWCPSSPKGLCSLLSFLSLPLYKLLKKLNYLIQNLTHGKKRSSTWTSFMVLAYEAFSVKLMSSTSYTIFIVFETLKIWYLQVSLWMYAL